MTAYRIFYMFHEKETSVPFSANTESEALAACYQLYPQIKPTRVEEFTPETNKRSGTVLADRITWDAGGCLARTFGFWSKNVRFYADIPPQKQEIFEKRYQEATGEMPEPESGIYNISQDTQKWSMEAEITFPETNSLPDDLAALQTANPGKIARIQLFWALMEHGFRLREYQNSEQIRAFVPEGQRAFFDQGIQGEHNDKNRTHPT